MTVHIPACNERGIYGLMLRGQIVYIGRSRGNLFGRLAQHARTKKFDAIQWAPVGPEEDLDAIEREMIKSVRPVYNSAHK